MTRKKDARILTKAPLIYALGQVVFTPIFSIEKYINDIQESLRKNGFPKVQKHVLRTMKIEAGSFPTVEETPGWYFTNKEDNIGITLTNNFISIDTTAYTTFDVIIGKFQLALEVLKATTQIDLVQRIGLRYVDLIRLEKGKSFSDYLQKELVGFNFDNIDINKTDYVSQATANTECGKLLFRCLRTNQGFVLPPDLLPAKLKLDETKQPEAGEWVTFLDFDHFNESQQDFIVNEIISTFWNLHDITGDAFFNNAITSYAKTHWGMVVNP